MKLKNRFPIENGTEGEMENICKPRIFINFIHDFLDRKREQWLDSDLIPRFLENFGHADKQIIGSKNYPAGLDYRSGQPYKGLNGQNK